MFRGPYDDDYWEGTWIAGYYSDDAQWSDDDEASDEEWDDDDDCYFGKVCPLFESLYDDGSDWECTWITNYSPMDEYWLDDREEDASQERCKEQGAGFFDACPDDETGP